MAVIIIMPFFILGPSYSGSFWQTNWPIAAVLALLFLAFNIFYFTNRRLFILLEKEDWPALVRFLEDKVIQKGRYSPRLVRLLANSYLVLSDSSAVMSLENKVAISKPALVEANALVFGTARILGRDIPGALHFFKTRIDTAKPGIREWVRWYHGFALLLNYRFEEAAEVFSFLARMSKDGVITALSSYFLSETIIRLLPEKRPEFREISIEGRNRVLKTLPLFKNWSREISRLSTDIHAAALSKYLDEAGLWLYEPVPESGPR
jgi:hypothetical protein